MGIRTTIASEINEHHAIATAKAGEAIQHAKEVGRLLLEVKAALPHGEFGKWLEQNITVSVRQAQRYIAVTEGKQVPIRALASKSDTVSHLTEGEASQIPEELREWFSEPVFSPTVGYWYCATTEDAAWWLVPSLEHPNHFHISKLSDEFCDSTKRPVPAWMAEHQLQEFGMDAPASLEWSSKKKEGLSRPFCESEAEPLSGNEASITKDRAAHCKSVAAVPEEEFEEQMQATFPHRKARPSSNSGA